jgi:phosphatidylserine/phosphatidylglycerophosphate/cardiolipin synthase-like enzyme
MSRAELLESECTVCVEKDALIAELRARVLRLESDYDLLKRANEAGKDELQKKTTELAECQVQLRLSTYSSFGVL